MASTNLTEGDVDPLLHLVIRAVERVKSEPDWAHLLPPGHIGFAGEQTNDEPLFYRRGLSLFRLDSPGVEAASVLARRLRTQPSAVGQADEHDVFMEVLEAVCAVVAGERKMKGLGRRLLSDVEERLGRSVNVLPVGGLVIDTDEEPLKLGDRVLLGALGEQSVEGINALSREQLGGAAFTLTYDAWWAEDMLSFRADPSAYDNVRPESGVSVVAVVVDAVGSVAASRARELVEAILGALWLVEEHRTDWLTGAPWIVGGPTMSETPRTPGFDEGGDLSLVVLQTSTREPRTLPVDFGRPRSLVAVRSSVAHAPKLFDLVAHAETPGRAQPLARRLAAACRLALVAGQDTATDLQLLHLVVGLEALVSDHREGSGVTDRFVKRVMALLPDHLQDAGKVDGLYRLRSEVGHQGFALTSKFDLGRACIEAREMLTACVLAVADIAQRHGFQSDTDVIRWLDASAPDLNKPFAN